MGLGLQTCLTLAVADAAGLALPVRDQFYVYGGLYLATGVGFFAYFVGRRWAAGTLLAGSSHRGGEGVATTASVAGTS